MGLFNKAKSIDTPWGQARVEHGTATVHLARFRGILIDLVWDTDWGTPQAELITQIRAGFDTYWMEGLNAIENIDDSMTAIIPESIYFPSDGDWDLIFSCPVWPDGEWRITFKDGKASHCQTLG